MEPLSFRTRWLSCFWGTLRPNEFHLARVPPTGHDWETRPAQGPPTHAHESQIHMNLASAARTAARRILLPLLLVLLATAPATAAPEPSLALGASVVEVKAACAAAAGTFKWETSEYEHAQRFSCYVEHVDGAMAITSFFVANEMQLLQIRVYAHPDDHEALAMEALTNYANQLGDPACEPGLCVWQLDVATAVLISPDRLEGNQNPLLAFVFQFETEAFRLLRVRVTA